MHPHLMLFLYGFLRPRGDAPVDHVSKIVARVVPPPTRRCTSAHDGVFAIAKGSSAHAEMHRPRRACCHAGRRFLRPRGDAPRPLKEALPRCSVPPPTRRCTSTGRGAHTQVAGSSAHAEMHRLRDGRAVSRHGFLRPRGDAPCPKTLGIGARKVPPPTRRCTARSPIACGQRVGSSAHAEMHPIGAIRVLVAEGFLRPRGDAPLSRVARGSAAGVPPPTRRCT